MNLANAFANIVFPACGGAENPLSARPQAGWRRGYAADCKSVSESGPKGLGHSENSADRCFCKHPGQTENEPKTLQTDFGRMTEDHYGRNYPDEPDRCEGCVVVVMLACAALTVFCVVTAIVGWWM